MKSACHPVAPLVAHSPLAIRRLASLDEIHHVTGRGLSRGDHLLLLFGQVLGQLLAKRQGVDVYTSSSQYPVLMLLTSYNLAIK